MMEFLLYLTPIGREIVNNVTLQKYNIRENAPICRDKQLYGIVKFPDFVICLNNIKNSISPVKHYVNETVYHEAVHVAQSCKGGKLGIAAPLSKSKMDNVLSSVKTVGSYPKYEIEAYYLEDKPTKVMSALKRYCF